ncbi:metallo-beta-lactamase domain protein [Leptospira broomii serovar Hurstbridge str. 5399]|uniref:Metallo-beta-lactamase domain protein n=1 Tax=Leptospira broomii serovar Hurstbridge str. 5399 TaxID=1049789 RepID=T0F6H6_9LEPT|nr:MBL fold metallo-hydrolase [Leptospira broomii]EQA43511.1 metallo-beta-lactamase domain protein [Leptospira broomii serovar Hurstbridge str. 5399]
MKFLSLLCVMLFLSCSVTSHTALQVTRGKPGTLQTSTASEKGAIVFQKVLAADWAAERSGLINLKDPKVKEAKLESGKEPIQIYFYVIDHPKFGRYIIDTGIADVFRKDPKEWPISALVASAMNANDLKIHLTADEWLKKESKPVKGILLTHLHLDHILGTLDFPAGTPIYTGKREASKRNFLNLFIQGTTDKILGPAPALEELTFTEGDGNSARVLDFFGDQSFYVIQVPGHTAGSLAFVVKSTSGLQLLTGDTCHTRWGWEHSVTPGEYTENQDLNRESLDFLKEIAAKFPGIKVHPGHQSLVAGGDHQK